MNKNKLVKLILITCFVFYIILSFLLDLDSGKQVANTFINFSIDMLKILPCAFILIGLFEVWVKKETVEKHLGNNTTFVGYIWVILLAGTTVGGLYVAFPVAYTLYKKGAKLSIIFTYIGAAAICRIPMTVFEASFMGIKFTLIRLFVSIPLVIFSSILLEMYLKKRNYKIKEGKNTSISAAR